MPSGPENLPELLHRIFGHREFRAHQREVCEAAACGRDVLLVMPTGAGKSLCYQLPALARRASGQQATALVISPLIALMDDQASKLAALNLRVARIHSGLDREASRQACRDYLTGELDFLFIGPERLRVPGFPEMLARRKPALIAVDEAHCISQWGHDFRPDYRTLGQHLAQLRPSPIIAVTATATPAVQRDIVRQLALPDPAIFITGFRRSNLAVEVLELSKPQRPEFTEKLLSEPTARPAIVYATSRKAAEELATRLNAKFRSAAYHAGLESATRDRVQRDFLAGKLDVIVATVAFGMGIDKADIRTVVHIALPGSVEAFYQEIGRAGRDGNASRSVLLYSFADRKMQEFLLERNYPPATDLQRVLRALSAEFVSPDYLQRKLKLDQETLERSLEKLITHGAATADFNGNVRIADEPANNNQPDWQDGYDAQVTARRRQIDAMMAFAEGATCRMTALVDHFGDRSDPVRSCGQCDICHPASATGSNMREPTASEREDLRAILSAVAARGTSTGKLFTDLALTRDRKHFDALLDGLARAALVTLTNDTFRTPEGRDVTYRKIAITHEGRTPDDETLSTVWLRDTGATKEKRSSKRDEKRSSRRRSASTHLEPRRTRASQPNLPRREPAAPKPLQTPQPKAPAAVEFNATQSALDARIRDWRKEQAHSIGLPSFFIFSDTVLRDIVLASPTSLNELRGIRGLGPDKLDRFGPAVLELCRTAM
ncbi:MAG TPA: RecQ family ATP-dependent DNA helicase [Acidobacteriaceae bacterium]|nr:RecQ family ATP-dependent DNA helicase [Acidobacteriaceae bacterium]